MIHPQSELIREPNLLVPRKQPVLPVKVNRQHPKSRNLLGYWLEKRNLVSPKNNFILNGNCKVTQTSRGIGLDSPGSSPNDASIPDNNYFSFGNGSSDIPFSISALVYYRDGGGASNGFSICSKYKTTMPVFDGEYNFNITSSGNLVLQILDNETTNRCRQDSNSALSKNAWYHLGFTYDASGVDEGLVLYKDGKVFPSTGFGQDASYVAMHNRTADFCLFSSITNADPYDSFGDGFMTDIRVYRNRVLTTEEAEIYRDPYQHLIPA